MARVTGYHRPASIEDALAALSAPGTPKTILAGGTVVNAALDLEPIEVVDLQGLGLDRVGEQDGLLKIGATVDLAELAAYEGTPALLADLAVQEAPSTLRAMGTVGGLVAHGDPESGLLAGLLAYAASVTTVDQDGTTERDLSDVLADGPGPGIITEISIETTGTGAAAGTARTPGDRPIVAAVARNDGSTVRLAMCGVAATPVLVDDVAALDPSGDFRGSAEYRKHLAGVLSRRVTEQVS